MISRIAAGALVFAVFVSLVPSTLAQDSASPAAGAANLAAVKEYSVGQVTKQKAATSQLRAIVQRYTHYVILAPYPTMKSRIALTAWTRIDAFDEFDEKRIVRFVKAYRGIDHHNK